jgi:phosphoserine phosphatase
MTERKTVVAMMYDFDKTLTTKDMQEYTFIPKVGMTSLEFWEKSNRLAESEQMDRILAYMKLMLEEATSHKKPIQRKDFVELGKHLEFFPGVTEWFNRINQVGKDLDIVIEHYIISSGLKEIIEGSTIGKEFKQIYASEYLYSVNGVAEWPKLAVNYTAKTQFLFRINKGVLNVFDDARLNDHIPENERPIPFRNMMYIGDGITDVPCMKLVKEYGGRSIAVHKQNDTTICTKLMRENRIDFYAQADYSPDKPLFGLVSTILRRMKAEDELSTVHREQMAQALQT